MEYRTINSTRIKKVGYIDDESTLIIQFNDGAEYEYYDVPKTIFYNLVTSKSAGKYFNEMVKNVYEYEKI